MAKRTGLGKGLGALIGDAKPEKEAPVERSKPAAAEKQKEEPAKEIFLKISSIIAVKRLTFICVDRNKFFLIFMFFYSFSPFCFTDNGSYLLIFVGALLTEDIF